MIIFVLDGKFYKYIKLVDTQRKDHYNFNSTVTAFS
jgi:hypothetical protein